MNKDQKALLNKQIQKLNGVTQDKEQAEIQAKSLGVKIPDKNALDFQPLFEHKKGEYRIDEKHFALMFMETMQKENSEGDLIPRYRTISRMLGIHYNTLKNWWDIKDELQAQQSALVSEGMKYVSSALMTELIRMLQALNQADYVKMIDKPSEMKNFITLMNLMMNKVRLFTGQSTSNVAHKHQVAMVVPDEEG
tara:strand:+ start:692 stop:1273 length:582 start_codon:yes stop_codon:yes gene_type:complete